MRKSCVLQAYCADLREPGALAGLLRLLQDPTALSNFELISNGAYAALRRFLTGMLVHNDSVPLKKGSCVVHWSLS